MKLRAHNTSGCSSGGDGGLGQVYGVADGYQLDFPKLPKWMYQSACGKSHIDMTSTPPTKKQFELCMSCPVLKQCREELIEMNPKSIVGTWAGFTNSQWKEFRKILKEEAA